MPQVRIISWNSTGENAQKGVELQGAQAQLAQMYALDHPDVDIFVIQEAQNAAGGAIYTMMNTDPATAATQVSLGPNINRPPDHCVELPNGGGAGYLACSHTNITPGGALQLWDYANDAQLNAWLATLNQNQRAAMQAAAQLRPPAYTTCTVGGVRIFLITWHTPRGPSPIGGVNMPGGALIDLFIVLQQSSILTTAQNFVGAQGVVIIAGDLNTTAQGLAYNNYYGLGYTPLPNFRGYSNNLDHILVWKPGPGNVNVLQGHHSQSSSVHDIISARVDW